MMFQITFCGSIPAYDLNSDENPKPQIGWFYGIHFYTGEGNGVCQTCGAQVGCGENNVKPSTTAN